MNYEQMIQRLIDGLVIIEQYVSPALQVVAHGYLVAIPQTDYDLYDEDEVETLIDMGWRWDKNFGWMLPVIG